MEQELSYIDRFALTVYESAAKAVEQSEGKPITEIAESIRALGRKYVRDSARDRLGLAPNENSRANRG